MPKRLMSASICFTVLTTSRDAILCLPSPRISPHSSFSICRAQWMWLSLITEQRTPFLPWPYKLCLRVRWIHTSSTRQPRRLILTLFVHSNHLPRYLKNNHAWAPSQVLRHQSRPSFLIHLQAAITWEETPASVQGTVYHICFVLGTWVGQF